MSIVTDDGVVDPGARSWVPGADESGFGLQHLPLGVGGLPGETPRPLARIGDRAVDLSAVARAGLLDDTAPPAALHSPRLNALLDQGPEVWHGLRRRLVDLLVDGGTDRVPEAALLAVADLSMELPIAVGDYVDFYSSIEHASNVGRIFRPDDEPLLPNWRHLPIGYHGRAGTVVVGGTPIRRPHGQRAPAGADAVPPFGPSTKLDIELELGFVVGLPRPRGRITTAEANRVVFGVALVNDWSARDIQSWEYRPLGPFLGKSFATSLAPWITPLPALAPFRVAPPVQEPTPLPYLAPPTGAPWGLDLQLAVGVRSPAMQDRDDPPTPVSRTTAAGLWWTIPQQLAHATVNGATTRSGDLYATGTISGAEPGSEGSFLELTHDGRHPYPLADGETRTWLADGDEVVLSGRATRDGHPPLTLAEVRGRILPAET